MKSNFPSIPLRNRGGYLKFDFIPYYDILSFPAIINNTVKRNQILLHAGKSWYQGYATNQTLQFNDSPEKTNNGTYFILKVAGLVPGDKPELTNLLFEMESTHFVVRLTDTRGKIKIIGSPTFPLEFKANFNSGDQRNSGKGYAIEFFGNALHRALEEVL
ncbi:MAG TPA: hypothetical protein VGB63_13145 [Pedobacter sp.]|jgi:hypothetical protein